MRTKDLVFYTFKGGSNNRELTGNWVTVNYIMEKPNEFFAHTGMCVKAGGTTWQIGFLSSKSR